MTNSPAPAKQKKPLWRRLLKWTLRVVILLAVLGIAAYAITDYWAAHAINAEVARIRAAGEPLTFDDLDKLIPKVDRAQDAGPYYAAAGELVNVDYENGDANFTNHNFFYGLKPIPAPVPPEALAWAHRGIDQNRLALDLVDRGSALPGCNSDIQLEYGIAVALPHLQRSLSNAISLRSRVLALEGHGDEAAKSAISSLGLLRMMDRQPIIIDVLIQISILARSCQDICITLERGHPPDAALQQLDAALRQLHLVQPREMFLADRVYFLEIMRNLIAYSGQMDPTKSSTPTFPERESWTHLGINGHAKVAEGLHSYARYITAASGDFPGILNNMQFVTDSPISVDDQHNAPGIQRAIVLYAFSLSAYRSTLIALQIERYRRAHNGTLPDSLAQLPNATGLPQDPFTGKPLLYVKTPDGYCVFSAGRGHPEDSNVDRDKDPIEWSRRWGTHIRIPPPDSTAH